MLMKEAVRSFYFHQIGNGISESTARGYRRTLEDLPFQESDLQEITPESLQHFISGQRKKDGSPLSPSSMNNRKMALRSFFGWATEADILLKNPARLIRSERIPQKEARTLSTREVEKLRRVIQRNERDHLLYEMFLHLGGRLTEIASLNVGDVRKRDAVTLIGKGKKSRVVPLSPSLRRLIRGSVNGASPDTPLFQSCRKQRLSTSAIEKIFLQYCSLAGIKGASVHALRHTFLSAVYRKTKDLRLTMELAGHSNPSTTIRYTHLSREDKKRAVQGLYGD